jgi:hypothetical protein
MVLQGDILPMVHLVTHELVFAGRRWFCLGRCDSPGTSYAVLKLPCSLFYALNKQLCLQDEPPLQKQDGLNSLMQLASGAQYQLQSPGVSPSNMQQSTLPPQDRSSAPVGSAPPGMYQRTSGATF